jgi:hypothetical protein
VGDGIAGLIEAVRKREGQIHYIGVRHEEAAASMASGYAKLTDKLGVFGQHVFPLPPNQRSSEQLLIPPSSLAVFLSRTS